MKGTVLATVEPSDFKGQEVRLAFVSVRDVPPEIHRRAQAHLRTLVYRHGARSVRLRYFGPANDGIGDIAGLASDVDSIPLGFTLNDGGTVALHHGLRGDLVVWAVAHEFAHVLAIRRGERATEAVCDAFANAYMRTL